MRLKSTVRENKSVSVTLPAPIKGLNRRDSLADMEATYAIEMDNYIPLDTKVVLRKGYVLHTQLAGVTGTLAVYKNGMASKMLAVSGGKFWNISSKNKVYAYEDISVSGNYFNTAQYKNYLYFVNGVDVPKVYYVDEQGHEHLDNWGFKADNCNERAIINVSVSKQHLWFIEKGTLKVWYAKNAGDIAGELKCFDLSQVSRYGGYLVAVANWTQDGGEGINDFTVFISSEGEALVYTGSNVSDAGDWRLRGAYKISRPIGYNCLVQYQGDVVIISEDGYIPLSAALPKDKANASQIAFSDTIRGLVLDRTQKFALARGWQGIIYSRGGYALFNVPLGKDFEQHVINVNTGAWCRFTGIKAACWCEFERRLYFASDNQVFLFDEGHSDNGNHIYGKVAQAYSNLGTERLKKIQLLNPRTKSLSKYALAIYTNMDMEKRELDYEEDIGNSGNSKWNTVKWSSVASPSNTKWESSGREILRSQWIANSSTGYKAGLVFKTKTKGNYIEWYETAIRYEMGNGVL